MRCTLFSNILSYQTRLFSKYQDSWSRNPKIEHRPCVSLIKNQYFPDNDERMAAILYWLLSCIGCYVSCIGKLLLSSYCWTSTLLASGQRWPLGSNWTCCKESWHQAYNSHNNYCYRINTSDLVGTSSGIRGRRRKVLKSSRLGFLALTSCQATPKEH